MLCTGLRVDLPLPQRAPRAGYRSRGRQADAAILSGAPGA